MKHTQINPWTWQDPYGYSQALKIDDARSLVVVSGQASISSEGKVVYEGDVKSQVRLTFENLRTVLETAGGSMEQVVKLGVFLLDIKHLPDYGQVQAEFFPRQKPAQTAVQVAALALPGMLVEVEALAVL